MISTVVAGTFNKFHKGHRAMIDAAFADCSHEVTIGITSDAYVSRKKEFYVPYKTRKERVEGYIKAKGFKQPYVINELNDEFGDVDTNPIYTRIIVSDETEDMVGTINAIRKLNGIPYLIATVVPLVMNEDGKKLSSTDIMAGKYTDSGKSCKSTMEVVMLGTAGGMSTTERRSAGILVKENRKHSVLFDCGNETSIQFQYAHENPNAIQAIFISHAHLDHYSGLPIFVLHHLMLCGREKDLDIYAPQEVIEAMDYIFSMYHIKPRFKINFIVLDTVDIQVGGLTIRPFYVTHSIAEAYGFRIMKDGKKVVYSGDTQPCYPLYKAAADADLLIHEATYDMNHEGVSYGHSTTYDAYMTANIAKAKKLVMTHLSIRHQFDMDLYTKDVEKLKEGSGFEIVVANDLDRFVV